MYAPLQFGAVMPVFCTVPTCKYVPQIAAAAFVPTIVKIIID
jgi:hypothetical protein